MDISIRLKEITTELRTSIEKNEMDNVMNCLGKAEPFIRLKLIEYLPDMQSRVDKYRGIYAVMPGKAKSEALGIAGWLESCAEIIELKESEPQ